MSIEEPDEALDEPLFPRQRPRRNRPPVPIYANLHAAFHLLDRRLEVVSRESGLSATDAIVLSTALTHPDQGIYAIRRTTGLRPSTLTSALDRLERRGFVRRVADTCDRHYTEIRLTLEGHGYAELSRQALRELDDELAVYLSPGERAACEALSAAAMALRHPGSQPDY